MSKFTVELKENGVNIKVRKQKILFDAEGNEIVIDQGNHASAIGVGDYDDPAAFEAAVVGMLEGLYGKSLAETVAKAKSIEDQVVLANKAIADLTDLNAQKDKELKDLKEARA